MIEGETGRVRDRELRVDDTGSAGRGAIGRDEVTVSRPSCCLAKDGIGEGYVADGYPL